MSGQTSEAELVRQVLAYRNGQWLYRYQITQQIQALDQRFSERAIHRALEEFFVEAVIEKRHGPRGGVMYRYFDPEKPISTRTDWDDLPIRPSSYEAVEWPE